MMALSKMDPALTCTSKNPKTWSSFVLPLTVNGQVVDFETVSVLCLVIGLSGMSGGGEGGGMFAIACACNSVCVLIDTQVTLGVAS